MSGRIHSLWNILATNGWQNFWDVVTSRGAIVVYLIILLLGIALVVIFAMISENRRAILQERADLQANQARQDFASAQKKDKNAEEEKQSRFFMLTQTDEKMKKKERVSFTNDITLQSLCERFRNFSASRL
ncbi:MAG: hypothetical protein E7381_05840, partial [Clostridiales bacterium]|nr:hypothetical protein [Clostridiales bacterium]